ncbi:hypothetical protein O185_24965 [Photorhabdus temperata J3]|uniref:Uncharacterized protein n=1 Tax=Photorhabdus temperata J3 TaxID=1389415 RepID=U7QR48_PHOTE|nr:hypothetical protein O185_24965 [Photorhabdus temperata J3]
MKRGDCLKKQKNRKTEKQKNRASKDKKWV